ncbi:MAG: hypothetical protein JJE51_11370 [Thermoanaerobaculia bacterium]|nr:hypothetical protein [Thermoanaerobaculia bacterium]
MQRFGLTVFILTLLARPMVAQRDTNNDGLVDVLVPIAVQTSESFVLGAYGSRWATETWVRTERATFDARFQRDYPCYQDPIRCTFAGQRSIRPQIGTAGEADRGVLLSFHPATVKLLTLSSRVLELSRNAQPNGVDVPVVWEGNYLTDPTVLLAIPQTDESRVALRIYDPRRRPEARFRVEFLSLEGSNQVIAETVLTTQRQQGTELYLPAYVTINDLGMTFPQLAGVERFDIRITPLEGPIEYWTFAAVTHRETQHVLFIVPDREKP